MLYDIALSIRYEYEARSDGGRQVLRLMPADLMGEQRLIAGRLNVGPEPSERVDLFDFFGNAATEVGFSGAHDNIEFSVQARVERMAIEPNLDISPPYDRMPAEIDRCGGLEPASPLHFIGPSPRAPDEPEIAEYARAQIAPGATAFEAVRAIGEALFRDMRFDAGATTVDTTPAEAFAARHGVCQDFSHVMICGLRGVGIPAGYVSGFLRTIPPEGRPRLAGADAMHAWVRVWCGVEAGWLEYDPTNGLIVGPDHIVVARGRDYGDVAPVKGVLRIAGAQKSSQAVDVMPLG